MLDLSPERSATPSPPAPRRPRAPVGCPRCGAAFGLTLPDSGPQTCAACGLRFEAVRFDPPLARAAVAGVGEAGPEAGTACANHEGNLATTHCGRCGLLICDLCRIEAEGMTLCPQCFARLSAAGGLTGTRTRLLDYTGLSFLCSLGGLLMCFGAPLLGPLGAYLAVRSMKLRREMGESRTGAVVALVIAIAVTAVGLFFIGAMIWGAMSG